MNDDRSLPPAGVSRRTFLTVGAAAGGGLLLGFSVPALARTVLQADADVSVFAPNAFIRIGADGKVALIVPYAEMGQGTYTSIPMLIAEELEVELHQVRVEPAPADSALYSNPLLGEQVTGGSTSIRAAWEPMRRAGAVARTMLIAAAAATWKVHPASCHAAKGQVIHGASGRSLAYAALAAKAAVLTVPDRVTLKAPKDFTLIGTSPKRLDTSPKIDGTAQFGIDVRLPDMKVATVAACPVFGGKLARVDDSKAKAVNGVRQIVRLDDAVAVVADHMGAARKGLAALEITWDEGANAHVTSAEIVKRMIEAGKHAGVVAVKHGDVDAAMKSAATTVEAEYYMPFLAHTTMEPMNCTVHIRKNGCDIWVGSQVVARARAAAAELTGLPPESVQIHNQFLGGGFGRRLEVDYVIQAVKIAKQVNAPVKLVWSREEDTQHDAYRPAYYDRLSAGLDRSGMPVSWHHRVVGSSVVARWRPDAFKNGLDGDAVEAAAGPYSFPNLLIDYVREEPPAGMVTGWWRGVGVTHNAFMVEGFIDELAHKAGRDPVEYRRALLAKAPRARNVLDLAAAKAGWGKPMAAGRGRGIAVLFGFGSYIAQVAEVAVAKDGQVRVERIVCAMDCGRTVDPDAVRAQMEGGLVYGLTAALYGEITVKGGRVEQANFDTYQALRMNETPIVEVHLVDSAEAPGGVGEPGTSAIGPAVVNAIFAATGKRLRRLPVDTTQLKSA